MKKYFMFDDEPITGKMYFGRYIVGSFLFLFGVGIWIISASAYKRSSTFNWSKEYQIISAIVIPIVPLSGILGQYRTDLNLLDFFAIITVLLHFILIFKNGNKIKN